MKKIILLTLLLSGFNLFDLEVPNAHADAVKLPNIKNGVGYSIKDNQFNYFATTDLISKWGFTVAGGYAGRAKNTGDKAVGTLTYELGNLSRWVEVPIAKYVDLSVGLYAGLGHVQINKPEGGNEFDWGVVANIISIKF